MLKKYFLPLLLDNNNQYFICLIFSGHTSLHSQTTTSSNNQYLRRANEGVSARSLDIAEITARFHTINHTVTSLECDMFDNVVLHLQKDGEVTAGMPFRLSARSELIWMEP